MNIIRLGLLVTLGLSGWHCQKQEILVTSAIIRPALKVNGTSALYFSIKNASTSDTKFIGITAPCATKAELHETYEKDGLAGMRTLEPFVIKRGETVVFQPGGKHVMLTDIRKDLLSGSHEEVTFKFMTWPARVTVEKKMTVRVALPPET